MKALGFPGGGLSSHDIVRCREDYGGVEQYLTRIGFGPEAQQRLARALAAPRLQTSDVSSN